MQQKDYLWRESKQEAKHAVTERSLKPLNTPTLYPTVQAGNSFSLQQTPANTLGCFTFLIRGLQVRFLPRLPYPLGLSVVHLGVC
jgi:hypothetical protein